MLYWVHFAWAGFELITLVVIGTDCVGSYKSNYHTITTTTAHENAAGKINTPQELFTAIQDIWMNFTVDYIQNLYTSIPRRTLAVIRSKGYLTKY